VEIMALFARLHEAGNTIIVVTHEPDIAAYAHRVISIRDGQVEKDYRQTPHGGQSQHTAVAAGALI
jgi:putative ABC transport system ATP-binding protein